jgi:hypothetical protein
VPSTADLQAVALKRGQKVKVVDDLPGVPAGTPGKVSVANGFTWLRYWVRFNNGMVVGHVDHDKLVRAKDYEQFLVARDREAIEAEKAAELAALEAERAASEAPTETSSGASGAADAGEAGASGSGGGDAVVNDAVINDAVVNGVTVPASFLEKAAAARARLGP